MPDIKEVWDADMPPAQANGQTIPGTAQIEFEIKKRVYCELEDAVKYVNANFPVSAGPSPDKLKPFARYPLPPEWITQISLSLQVDESSSLGPGLTLNTVLPNSVRVFGPGSSVSSSQSSSVGLGGTLSSTATRIDKFDPSWSIAYLMQPDTKNSVCLDENDPFKRLGWQPDSSSPFILESDLGIKKWLVGAVITDVLLNSQTGSGGSQKASSSSSGGGTKPDTISYEIKFIIVSNGNVTPTWKLVKFSANTTGTLFAAGRTRTHDLIITIGPNDSNTLNSHLAAQIGQAVSGGNTTLQTPLQ